MNLCQLAQDVGKITGGSHTCRSICTGLGARRGSEGGIAHFLEWCRDNRPRRDRRTRGKVEPRPIEVSTRVVFRPEAN